MRFDVRGVLSDAWAMARVDGDLLFRIAGLFLFLPQYALLLLVPPMPALAVTADMSEADQMALARTIVDWFAAYGGWYLSAALLVHMGSLVVLLLYMRGDRPRLGEAIGGAVRLFPRYLIAMMIVGIPLGLGVLTVVLLLPGLYVLGRMIVLGPMLAEACPASVRAGLSRSWAMTRGHGLVLAGLASLTIIAGVLASAPFSAMDKALRTDSPNPVALALVDAGAAAATAAALLATILIQIAAYRRLSNRGI